MFHGIGSSLFYIWFNFVKDILLFKKNIAFFLFPFIDYCLYIFLWSHSTKESSFNFVFLFSLIHAFTLFFFLSPFQFFFSFYFFFYIPSLLTYFCYCSYQPYLLLNFYTPNWCPFFLIAPNVLLLFALLQSQG